MPSTDRPVMGFLTDFGLDGAAATCRAVMLSICRDAQIVDIAHTIRKYAIRDGAFLLRFALPYFPVGVHVGVVDPGVGTERRAIGVRTGRGDILIGPDNGLLLPPAEALGGIEEARELTYRNLWLPVTTSTFHGRDIFAPVAAHLAAGDASFEEVGATLEPDGLVEVPEPAATVRPGTLETVITYVDSFGNARLAGERDALAASLGELRDGLEVTIAIDADGSTLREDTQFASTFGAVPVGTSLLYIDSLGNLALADNQGNLARRLGIQPDQRVTITPRA
jgi:S-adenosylmethionine hydrolase